MLRAVAELPASRANHLERMFECDTAARDLIVREPFASLAEAICGEDVSTHGRNLHRNSINEANFDRNGRFEYCVLLEKTGSSIENRSIFMQRRFPPIVCDFNAT